MSAANSLVGGHFQDSVGLGITALTNGNYVVNSLLWDNGGIVDAGAVTWGNGTTGVKGLVTALNSLVGTHTNDNIGSGGVTALSNGNYLVESSFWDYGAFAFVNAGAVSKGNGATGTSGTVSALNSVVGQASNAFLDPSLILDPVNHTFFSVFNGEGGGRVRVSLQ